MIFYINRTTGSVLLAYYNNRNIPKLEAFWYEADEWEELPFSFKDMNELREEICNAGLCDIILDDGDA